MIRKLSANKLAKKSLLFALAFVLIGAIMASVVPVGNHNAETFVQATALTRPVNVTPAPTAFTRLSVQWKQAAYPVEETLLQSGPIALQALPAVAYQEPAEGFVYLEEIPMSHELQAYTYQRCKEQNVDYELVLAIMWRESRFQVDAVNVNENGTQDSGIMQINDINKTWLFHEHGIDDLMDPLQNIDAGTAMLAKFIRKYGEHDALMAYQYGEAGMNKKFEEGVITNDQVAIVIEKRSEFARMKQAEAVEVSLQGAGPQPSLS